jgi:hypothetical protein
MLHPHERKTRPRETKMAKRHPNSREQALYGKVFGSSLPSPKRIYISDDLGLEDRPWTQPRWFMDLSDRVSGGGFCWEINIGPDGYKDCTSVATGIWGDRIDATLIHELTHVWQGYHATFPDMYAVRAGLAQLVAVVSSYDPYTYGLGYSWDDYSIEQKAQIVEDWYTAGMSTADPRFAFIRDNIRKGVY